MRWEVRLITSAATMRTMSNKYKAAEKAALEQRQVVGEIEALVKSIERCEKTIAELKVELEQVNEKHKGRSTTQEDIAYLTDLLKCANKKLGWEKQMASLQKKTPALLERMSTLINDPVNPPTNEVRAAMLQGLEAVRSAMEKLEKVKVE
jgi:FtsZ-binding cell division protein ZapB